MSVKTFKPKRVQKQSAAELRKNALRRLRERWEKENEGEDWEPEKEPVVSPMFAACEGGTAHILEALRAHDDDDAKAFIDEFDSASVADRKYLPIEAIAFAAGIGSLRLAELAQTAIFLYDGMKTKMLIASNSPKVVKSIVKAATDEVPITIWVNGQSKVVGYTNGDVKAMEIFGKMAGFVPVPKNSINIYNHNGTEKEDAAPTAPLWRTAEDRLREIHDATEPKRLPSPESKPILVGGHIDRMQSETVEILRGE